MDKLKLAAIGERLKTGGAQMSRKVSGKMKEFLQVQTPEAKMVDEATSESLPEPNWGLNLRICALLNAEELSGPEVMRAIKKKIASKSMVSQRFSLDLLEACAMNCDKVFSEIASEKVLEEMVRLIDNLQTHFSNRERALQLIKAWGESSDLGYLPVFQQTYASLKERGFSFSGEHTRNLAELMDSNIDEQTLSFPEGYPNPNFDQDDANQIPVDYYHRTYLSKEEKTEALVVARNSIELLSSINSGETQKPVKDDLTISLLERCKQSQVLIQRIIESTVDDENLLFEALNINEELQQVISRHEGTEAVSQIQGEVPGVSDPDGGSSCHDQTVRQSKSLVSPTEEEKTGSSDIGANSE
ncbi:TOM1-like protein 2 isoform X2 [Aristolochia californica]|uniref:TOM1-like protein 2 isoform X2 n=1 Tax=Aristolochia californica TaxID=171875 RepID=UPI0035DFA034